MSFTLIIRPTIKNVFLTTQEQGFLCVSSEVKRFTFWLLKNNVLTEETKRKTKRGLSA